MVYSFSRVHKNKNPYGEKDRTVAFTGDIFSSVRNEIQVEGVRERLSGGGCERYAAVSENIAPWHRQRWGSKNSELRKPTLKKKKRGKGD